MANRKSTPDKSAIQKTVTPIGQDVPKGGIPVESKSIENLNLEESQRSVTGKKVQPFHKDDGLGGKIGPKQISQKMEPDLLVHPKKTTDLTTKKK